MYPEYYKERSACRSVPVFNVRIKNSLIEYNFPGYHDESHPSGFFQQINFLSRIFSVKMNFLYNARCLLPAGQRKSRCDTWDNLFLCQHPDCRPISPLFPPPKTRPKHCGHVSPHQLSSSSFLIIIDLFSSAGRSIDTKYSCFVSFLLPPIKCRRSFNILKNHTSSPVLRCTATTKWIVYL